MADRDITAASLIAAVLAISVLGAGLASAHDDLQGLDTVTPEGVTVVHRSDGIVFADANGLTLYRFDEDMPEVSTCYRERHCERRWPPLQASKGAVAVGDWTVIERGDGTLQWAYRDAPVYTSSEDLTPGIMSGDNARQTWHALFQPFTAPAPEMPPGLTVMRVETDWVFADSQGRLLHFPAGAGDCEGDCLYRWAPLAAPALAHPVGDWTIEVRSDGSRQWACAGRAAYYVRRAPIGAGAAAPPGWSPLLAVEPTRDPG